MTNLLQGRSRDLTLDRTPSVVASAVFWALLGILGTTPLRPAGAMQAIPPDQQAEESNSSTAEQSPLDLEQMAAELELLASKCDALGLRDEARTCREWLPADRPDQFELYLPLLDDPTQPAKNADRLVTLWYKKFTSLRQRHSDFWFQEAERQAADGDEAAAFQSIYRCLRENPEHATAKGVLGGEIGGLRARPQARPGSFQHPRLGWPARSYHIISTPHFSIVTNASPKTAVELATKMERFRAVWTQLFSPLWMVPGALKGRLDKKNVPLAARRELKIVLFATREDYLRFLGQVDKQIAISIGSYNPQARTCYFYLGDDQELLPTLMHEITHQLMQEDSLLQPREDFATRSDFWIVEGLALYLESTYFAPTYVTVGGWESPRLQVARYRRLREEFWVPWQELRSTGRESWRSGEDLPQRYTQSAGLVHWWLDSGQADALPTLQKYLISVYQDAPRHMDLPSFLDDDKLRAAYDRFLQVQDAVVMQTRPSFPLRDAALTRCPITSAAVENLAQFPQLNWLDVGFSKVDDSISLPLSKMKNLERLTLESCNIGGKAIDSIGDLKKLKELDLSDTPLQSTDLKPLSRHPKLQTLWLTNTKVDDAAVDLLLTCTALTYIDLRGTLVTSSAVERLKKARPQCEIGF